MHLESHNFHWRDGFSYDYPQKRDVFDRLVKSLKHRRICVLTGTRRTGKTTLMKQFMDHLIGSGTPRANIVYFSFDEDRPSIREILKEYERRIAREMAFSKERYFVFLDEIQKLDDWQNKIKYFYDNYKNIKFFVSGSASLFIREKARESLAGRMEEISLGPLSFAEYLRFRNKDDILAKPDMFRDALKAEFGNYLFKQYIEVLDSDEAETREYVRSIVEKVVYIDIARMFGVEDPEILMKIVKLVASNPGMLLDHSNLAQTLSTDTPVSRARISRYVHHLEDSYILKLVYNHSGSGVVSERKLKKAYLANPTLSLISDTSPIPGKLAEQSFVLSLGSRFFWRNPQKEEVDIILEQSGRPLPVEVKFQATITKSDMRGLRSFMRRRKTDRAVIITKDTEKMAEVPEGVIRMVPAWKAALFGIGE